jgi:hypothetical protein
MLTEQQIAKIIQYWEKRENLENQIRDLEKIEPSGYEYKFTDSGFIVADRQIDEQKEELAERIEKLGATYEKWLKEKVGLKLKDRDQDEFTYNLLNNGVSLV